MNYIPRNVVRDLLPVYLAGEASSETRELVEYHLERDHELRELLESVEDTSAPQWPWPSAPDAAELRALDETTRLLNRKLLFCTASFSLTSVAMAMALERAHVWLATLLYLSAICGWIFFLATCRRLSATGLEPPRPRTLNTLWSGIGGYVGHTAYHLLLSWNGYPPGDWSSYAWLGLLLTFAGWAIAWQIGRKWHFTSPGLQRLTKLA
jgi:hypothetical protein